MVVVAAAAAAAAVETAIDGYGYVSSTAVILCI